MYATPVMIQAIGLLILRQRSVPAQNIISIKAISVVNALMDAIYVQMIKFVSNVMQMGIGFLISATSVDVKIIISMHLRFNVSSAQ
jgi:hypothetical protein